MSEMRHIKDQLNLLRLNKIVLSFFLILNFVGYSQNFAPLSYLGGNGASPYFIRSIFTDSVHNKLIVSSDYINYAGNKKVRGVWSWDGIAWDSLRGGINTHDMGNDPNGFVFSGIPYNGKLLVGGGFMSIGGKNASSLATWDGNNWDSLPVRAFKFHNNSAVVTTFLKHNGLLYLGGSFDTIQGQKASSLATFNGSVFTPIILPLDDGISIASIVNYNNEIYIGGNFTNLTNPIYEDILKFNGTSWTDVGGGIKGLSSGIGSMVVYNNFLYVAGYFEKNTGNAGNLIMKWDGSQWSDAAWGNTANFDMIFKLLVHHNKLYAFGRINQASNMPASMVAVLDGNKWCTLNDSINEVIFSAAVYKDTLYASGNFKRINGDTTMRCIAKLKNENLYDACMPIGLKENQYTRDQVKIYPNPTKDKLYIESEIELLLHVNITNTLGQEIPFVFIKEKEIDVSHLPKGIYFIRLKLEDQIKRYKFIKE